MAALNVNTNQTVITRPRTQTGTGGHGDVARGLEGVPVSRISKPIQLSPGPSAHSLWPIVTPVCGLVGP